MLRFFLRADKRNLGLCRSRCRINLVRESVLSTPEPSRLKQKVPDVTGARPDCRRCLHFSITWIPRLPYQCNLLGFRSRMIPCVEVIRADGESCRGFSPKFPVPVR